MNPNVDFYFTKTKQWQDELSQLRTILLDSKLTEDLKWGVPCYTFQKNNIALIHKFKDYCAVLFFKGVLLKDPKKILVQQTENVQAARQMRFTSAEEILKMATVIKAYIDEAIEVEKSGMKVELKKTSEFEMAEEFKHKLSLKGGDALKAAFDQLTAGRQRAYLLYFSAPKQSKTRASRVEKSIPQILKGKGLNDE